MPTPPISTYSGILWQMVTQTNDPKYYPGQVFPGFYQYSLAGGPSGTFYTQSGISPAGANQSLTGLLYLAYPDTHGGLNSFLSTVNNGELVVTNGQITLFTWSSQSGSYYAQFSTTSFHFSLMNQVNPTTGQPLPNIETRGTIGFTQPIRQG